MNIFLINHYAGSPRYGMEYRPYYLAKEWVKKGHSVCIVASSESHYGRKNPVIDGNVTYEKIDGIRYIWLKTRPYHGNGIARVFNMFSFVLGLYRWQKHILDDFIPDVVIASSTYPLDVFFARKIAKQYATKFIFEVHDLWPLTPQKLGGMSKYHPFIMLLQRGEDYYCKHADKIVSMLPRADKHLVKRGLNIDKFICIPNGVNTDLWEVDASLIPSSLQVLIRKLKNSGYFIIGYTGAVGVANAMDVLVDAACLLREHKIAFVIVGEGLQKENLIDKASQLNLDNVYFHNKVAKEVIPAILDQFDALYIGWNQSELYQYGISPNKLMDYMMAARPIIHSVEAANDIVAESQCGISVEPENPVAVSKACLALHKMDKMELTRMGKHGYDYVLRELDYPVLAQRFLSAI